MEIGLELGFQFDGIKGLTHQTADLKLDRLLGRHRYTLKSAGILGNSCCSLSNLEDPEITKLKTTSVTKFLDDIVEKTLNGHLHDGPLLVRLLGNAIDEVLLGSGCLCSLCHDQASPKIEQLPTGNRYSPENESNHATQRVGMKTDPSPM